MWCLVSQPNTNKDAFSSVVIEVRVGNKATGQECLNQVCQKLGIIESDYFGLQFKGARNEELWLNLRNEIRQEISAHPSRSSFRFQLRVKFWVPPHLLLQEATRHQFYLHTRLELLEGHLILNDLETAIRVSALAAQAELGDSSGIINQEEFYSSCLPGLVWNDESGEAEENTQTSRRNSCRSFHFNSHNSSQVRHRHASSRASFLPSDYTKSDWFSEVSHQHCILKGMSSSVAEYWMLKEVSKLEGYGTETFLARWIGAGSINVCSVAIGPQGICIRSMESEQHLSIPFSSIEAATNTTARFQLKYVNDTGQRDSVAVKLDSHQTSVSLYRSITEKHAFYSCETVGSAVTSQFVRDLKGTIASFFNENTDLGKKYVFDIQRTCREVYDNARRILYQNGTVAVLPVLSPASHPSTGECVSSSCKAVREHLSRIQEALLCSICMDNDIEVAFCPCGHSLACLPCAQRCDQCPVCRANISHTQTIFLPLIGIEKPSDGKDQGGLANQMADQYSALALR